MPPSRFGKYEVLRRIATGGMAEVYLCRLTGEEGFRKRVALKVIHPRHADDPRFRGLFAREARLAATLSHPNLVQVFDFGRVGDGHYLAMEFVEGWNLAQAAARARQLCMPVPPGVWRHWVEGIWSGIAYLHGKGIVHGDMSPSNVLVGRNGTVKITDFGISRVAGEASSADGDRGGKSGYLSPERVRGEEAGAASDLFAAAVIAAELLLSRRLFAGSRTGEIAENILSFRGSLLPLPGVDPQVAAILRKALAAASADRYPAAHDFLLELSRVSPARAAMSEVAEYWDALFPGGAEEETSPRLGDGAERRPAVVREAGGGYGFRNIGVPAVAAAALVALVAGGVLVWKNIVRGIPASRQDRPTATVMENTSTPAVPAGDDVSRAGNDGAQDRVSPAGVPAAKTVRPILPAPPADIRRPARHILIDTEPQGATVSLEDGPEIGKTPLLADAWTLEGKGIVLAREGYERKTIPGSALREGNRDSFRTELAPLFGTVEAIQAIPWAKVYLGDRYLGDTPLVEVRLPVGRHRLRFVNDPLGAQRSEVVDVRPGKNPKVIVPMAGPPRN